MPKQITYEKDGYIYTYDLIECPSSTFNEVELPNDDIITKDGQVISNKLYGYKLVYTNETMDFLRSYYGGLTWKRKMK